MRKTNPTSIVKEFCAKLGIDFNDETIVYSAKGKNEKVWKEYYSVSNFDGKEYFAIYVHNRQSNMQTTIEVASTTDNSLKIAKILKEIASTTTVNYTETVTTFKPAEL